jgi:hypothetical protein
LRDSKTQVKIQVTLGWGSSPKIASGSLWWSEVEHLTRIVSPLLLHLSLLHLLNGADPLASLSLPILSGLDVRVQRLLYSSDLNGEISRLLCEISISGRG